MCVLGKFIHQATTAAYFYIYFYISYTFTFYLCICFISQFAIKSTNSDFKQT